MLNLRTKRDPKKLTRKKTLKTLSLVIQNLLKAYIDVKLFLDY